MTKQELIAKKTLYEAQKVELTLDNNKEEIELKVAEYRKQLEAEYEQSKQDDIKKLDNYIDLLTELINDAEIAEQEASQIINEVDTSATLPDKAV